MQPITAFVYCDCHTAAGHRRQADVGNFHDGTTREIK